MVCHRLLLTSHSSLPVGHRHCRRDTAYCLYGSVSIYLCLLIVVIIGDRRQRQQRRRKGLRPPLLYGNIGNGKGNDDDCDGCAHIKHSGGDDRGGGGRL